MIVRNGATIPLIMKGTTPIRLVKKGLETVLEAMIPMTLSVAGQPPYTLENSAGNNLIDFKIYGRSLQDGTPTPETPIEVESVGEYDETAGKYKIPVKISGKNYFNGQWEKGFINNSTGMNSSSSSSIRTANYIELKPNTKYYVTVPSGNNYPFTYKKDKSFSRYLTLKGKSFSFTTTADEYYFRLARYADTNIPANVQIEVGSVATEYEPYIEPTTTNIYLNEPLRKIGDYADYIDYKNKKVVRKIYQGKLIDVLSGSSGSQYANGLCRKQNVLRPKANYNIAPMSNSLKGNSGTLIVEANTISVLSAYSNAYVYFNISDVCLEPVTTTTSNQEIGTAINNYIIERNIDLTYVLETPTEETIELPTIATIKGTNIVDIETDIKPDNVEITYWGQI